jgi:hypothetical protein
MTTRMAIAATASQIASGRKTKIEIVKRNPKAQLSPNEVRGLFQNARSTDKCPYHPQGKHTAAACAQNPANAHDKAFDKFRPKQRPGADKRNGKNERCGKAEAHVIEASIDASQANNANPDRVEFAAYNTNVAQSLTGGFNVADFPVTKTMTRETMNDIRQRSISSW